MTQVCQARKSIEEGKEITTERVKIVDGQEIVKKGHGIGLAAISKNIKELQGELKVSSSQDPTDHGSTFVYILPGKVLFGIKEAPLSPASPSLSESPSSPGVHSLFHKSPKKIYFLDDNPVNSRIFPNYIMNKVIKSKDKKIQKEVEKFKGAFEIKSFLKSEDLINAYKTNASNVAGIILDLNLVGDTMIVKDKKISMNGYLIEKTIRELEPEQLPKIPIYFYSADKLDLIEMEEKENEGYKKEQFLIKAEDLVKPLIGFLNETLLCGAEKKSSQDLPTNSPSSPKREVDNEPSSPKPPV